MDRTRRCVTLFGVLRGRSTPRAEDIAFQLVPRINAAHRVEDTVKVGHIAHLKDKAGQRQEIIRSVHRGREDIHMVLGEHPGHIRKQTRAVKRFNLNVDEEHASLGWRPLDLNHPIGTALERPDVRTVSTVDRHPCPPGNKTNDGVTGDRRAASGELDQDVWCSADEHAGLAHTGGNPPPGWTGENVIIGVLV
jgi:hypothetical protein